MNSGTFNICPTGINQIPHIDPHNGKVDKLPTGIIESPFKETAYGFEENANLPSGYEYNNRIELKSAPPFMIDLVKIRDGKVVPDFDEQGFIIGFRDSYSIGNCNVHHAFPRELFRHTSPEVLKSYLSRIKGLGNILTQNNYPEGDSLLNMIFISEDELHARITQNRDAYYKELYEDFCRSTRLGLDYQAFTAQKIYVGDYPLDNEMALRMVALSIFNTASLDGSEAFLYRRLKTHNKSHLNNHWTIQNQQLFVRNQIKIALSLFQAAKKAFPDEFDLWADLMAESQGTYEDYIESYRGLEQ